MIKVHNFQALIDDNYNLSPDMNNPSAEQQSEASRSFITVQAAESNLNEESKQNMQQEAENTHSFAASQQEETISSVFPPSPSHQQNYDDDFPNQ